MTEVGEIMSSPVFAVAPSDNLARARKLMLRNGVSRLAVMDGDILKGIITKKDMGVRLNQAEPQWRRRPLDHIPVEIVMTPDPITVGPKASVSEAARLMLDNKISGIIVMDGGVQGIVTKLDFVKYFTLLGSPLRVGDMMSRVVVTVSRHNTINSVIDIMEENGVDRVVVNDGNEAEAYVGMVTLDDLGMVEMNPRNVKEIKEARRENAAGPKTLRRIREVMMVAEDVMASPLVYVKMETPAQEAAVLMVEKNFDMLPVVNGRMTGQFNYECIMKWLTEDNV